jgi:hypothetical protein
MNYLINNTRGPEIKMNNNITINTGGIILKTIPKDFFKTPGKLVKRIRNQQIQENFSFGHKNSLNSNDAAIYHIAQKDGRVNSISHRDIVSRNPSLLKLRSLEGHNPLKVSYNADLLINDTSSFDTKSI